MANSRWITDSYVIETSEPVEFWVTRYILAQYGGSGKFSGVIDISPRQVYGKNSTKLAYASHPVDYTIRKIIEEEMSTDDPKRMVLSSNQ